MNTNEISGNILDAIEEFFEKYRNIDDVYATVKIENNKWSLKQIIGHLIDSASNNHQRIIRHQLENKMSLPDYNREEWLGLGDYNSLNYSDLLTLLRYYNKLISSLISNIKEEHLKNYWCVKWTESKNLISLEELVEHYFHHLTEHFYQFEKRFTEIKNINTSS